MRLKRSWIPFLVFALMAVGCGWSDEPKVVHAPWRSTLFDSARYAEVSDRLRDAFPLHDSAYCDSVLPLFNDTALARIHPDRVVDGYVSSLIGHNAPQPPTWKRFNELVDYSDAPVMHNWRDYVIARALQNDGRRQEAIAAFEPLQERFLEARDTVGIASVSKRMGTMYLELGEPRIAAKYLLRARSLEPRIDLRAVITATLGRCYVQTGQMDSVRWCIDRLNEDANRNLNVRRGDSRAAINARWLAHLSALMSHDRSGMAAAIYEGPVVDSLINSGDDGYLVAGDPAARMETTVLRARALMSLGRLIEARETLRSEPELTDQCDDRLPQRLRLLSASSDVLAALGDHRSALHFQQERADVLALNEVGRERLAVEQARAQARRAMQEVEASQLLEQERSHAALQESEHRMNRRVLIVLVGMMALLGALLISRARTRRRIEVERMRGRLARDLHDDIGSTLSSINILSSVARKRVEATGDSDASDALSKISDRSQRLMRNMSDIVWSVDPEKDSLEGLLARMREFGTSLFDPKDIAFTFDQPANITPVSLPVETKNNLYLLYKEALNNAVKHAHCGRVETHVTIDRNTLRLIVKDDGAGMDMDAAAHHSSEAGNWHGGNGLRNMRERAKEMRAELRIASTPGSGCSVEVTLQI